MKFANWGVVNGALLYIFYLCHLDLIFRLILPDMNAPFESSILIEGILAKKPYFLVQTFETQQPIRYFLCICFIHCIICQQF